MIKNEEDLKKFVVECEQAESIRQTCSVKPVPLKKRKDPDRNLYALDFESMSSFL